MPYNIRHRLTEDLLPEARQRLARVAASGTAKPYGWLESAWVSGEYC